MMNFTNKRTVFPIIDDDVMAILKYANHVPKMNWYIPRNYVSQRGAIGLRYNRVNINSDINICFHNEIETHRLSIIFEYPVGFVSSSLSYLSTISSVFGNVLEDRIIGIGFFFTENMISGEIDMSYRIKYLDGTEKLVVYRSVRYFALDMDVIYDRFQCASSDSFPKKMYGSKYKKISCFTISNEWQDKTIYVAIDLYNKKFYDFHYVVEFINSFIQNNLKAKQLLENPQRAYPLLLNYHNYRNLDGYLMYHENQAISRFPENRQVVNIVSTDTNSGDNNIIQVSDAVPV